MPNKFVVELTDEQIRRMIDMCEEVVDSNRTAMKMMDPSTDQQDIADTGKDCEFVRDIQDHLVNTYQEGK